MLVPRSKLGRELINLPGGRLAEVRYAPMAVYIEPMCSFTNRLTRSEIVWDST
jgi:hypothetical protein